MSMNIIQFVQAMIAANREAAGIISKARDGAINDIAVEMEEEADLAEAILHETLELTSSIDSEWGCYHDVEALLAGGRSAGFTGDEFEPLPAGCRGVKEAEPMLKIIARFWSSAEGFDPTWAADYAPPPPPKIEAVTMEGLRMAIRGPNGWVYGLDAMSLEERTGMTSLEALNGPESPSA